MPVEQDKLGGFKFTLGEELRSGIYPDLFPSRVPLWEDGQNVRFTDRGVEKAGGYTTSITTADGNPIRGVLQYVESDAFVAYFGDTTKLYRGDLVAGTYTEKGTGFALLEDAGASVWDSGTSTWDSGTSLWDFGINDAEHWSLVNYGSFIFATAPSAGPHVKKTTGVFTPMYQGVVGATITSGGTGYVVSDVLTFTGGTFTTAATCTVTQVTGGAIAAVEMTTAGSGYTAAPTGVSGGTGSGATITGQITDLDVTSVKIWVNRGPHLLGFNTSNSDKEFIFCDTDDPDTWQTTASNRAGALQIRELNTQIVAAVPIGNRIAVYGEDQMFLVSYLANDLVFGYVPALNGIGAVAPQSVVSVGSLNYGLSTQGFFVTDGSRETWIDMGKLRYWFETAVNSGQVSKAVGYHDEVNREVVWSFPTANPTASVTVAYNYESQTWTFYGRGLSSAQERTVYLYPILGTEDGKVQFAGNSPNADGSALTAYIRTKPIDLGSADRVKELSSIRVGYRGSDLQYRIGWAETEDGTITWGSYRDVNAGYDFHNLRTAGRYLFLEFYSNVINAEWDLMSVEIQGRVEGTR